MVLKLIILYHKITQFQSVIFRNDPALGFDIKTLIVKFFLGKAVQLQDRTAFII